MFPRTKPGFPIKNFIRVNIIALALVFTGYSCLWKINEPYRQRLNLSLWSKWTKFQQYCCCSCIGDRKNKGPTIWYWECVQTCAFSHSTPLLHSVWIKRINFFTPPKQSKIDKAALQHAFLVCVYCMRLRFQRNYVGWLKPT